MVRKLFGILLAMIVVLIVIGFMLPTTLVVERSRVIDRSPEVLFEVLSDLHHFTQWAPWLVRNPDMDWRLEGPDRGVGATLVWRETPESGESRLRIVGTTSPERVDLILEMADTEFENWFHVTPEAGGQRVSWGMRAQFGALDLVGRYVGLILPGLIGNDYREGLERLEAYLEQSPGGVPRLPESRD